MKVKVIGCGNAFSKINFNQSFLLEENGERLLIDMGRNIPEALSYNDIDPNSIDYVYISHNHSDHNGGLEWLAFLRYDWGNRPEHYTQSKRPVPKLIANDKLIDEIWEKSLRGGLESMEGFDATIETFFEPIRVKGNHKFNWQGWDMEFIQQVHIMTGSVISNTFGVYISKGGHESIYFTTDSQHCSPKQMEVFYKKADIIIQDCEVSPYMSGVHANYIQLRGDEDANSIKLPPEIKAKMWLSHYQDCVTLGQFPVNPTSPHAFYRNGENPIYVGGSMFNWNEQAEDDGFRGFLTVGQELII